jgi:hypothetical protein
VQQLVHASVVDVGGVIGERLQSGSHPDQQRVVRQHGAAAGADQALVGIDRGQRVVDEAGAGGVGQGTERVALGPARIERLTDG